MAILSFFIPKLANYVLLVIFLIKGKEIRVKCDENLYIWGPNGSMGEVKGLIRGVPGFPFTFQRGGGMTSIVLWPPPQLETLIRLRK